MRLSNVILSAAKLVSCIVVEYVSNVILSVAKDLVVLPCKWDSSPLRGSEWQQWKGFFVA